jgi:16S rRNA processing protein RimM
LLEDRSRWGEFGIDEDFITLARVVKTQGRVGEVVVELHSDIPDRLTANLRVFALATDGVRRELNIEEVWPHQGRTVVKFRNLDSISDAQALVGCEIQVPLSERAALEYGWTYVSDLVGCTLFDGDRQIGTIEDVQFGAGEAPLLTVRAASDRALKAKSVAGKKASDAKEYEIPFAEAYLEKVDLDQKRVHMRLPEGMLEINAPLSEEEKREQQKGGKHTRPD